MRLSWNPPKDNGGARVDKYILEKRPKGAQRWQKVGSLPAHVVDKPSPTLFKTALLNIDFMRAFKFTRNL